MSGWIGVDLDGCLAEYHGWVSEDHIGAPVPKMLERVKRWLADGRDVRIFTARVTSTTAGIVGGNAVKPRDVAEVCAVIDRWCLEHVGQTLPITNVKDWGCVEIYDDRCVQVRANTGELVGESTRGLA